jgi:hypothetical protein
LHVLNEVLERGGDNGGMGPGTTWRRFKLKETEYIELVEALLNLDVEAAKKAHPYILFRKAVVEEELSSAQNYIDWLNKRTAKRKNSLSSQLDIELKDQ